MCVTRLAKCTSFDPALTNANGPDVATRLDGDCVLRHTRMDASWRSCFHTIYLPTQQDLFRVDLKLVTSKLPTGMTSNAVTHPLSVLPNFMITMYRCEVLQWPGKQTRAGPAKVTTHSSAT